MNNKHPQHNPTRVIVPFERTEDVKCPHCGNISFYPVHFLRKVPALYSPDNKETVQPMQGYECARCQKLMEFGQMPAEKKEKRQIGWKILERALSILPFFLRKK